jgi:hypothetical protein
MPAAARRRSDGLRSFESNHQWRKAMIGKSLKWSDFKYVAKFSEFWTALAVMAAAAFLLGLAAA